MTVTTVFLTGVSFLAFASARETDSVPKLADLVWNSAVGANPPGIPEDPESSDAFDVGNNHETVYDIVTASYLILGFENDHFQGAYIAFPGRSNFDEVTKAFLRRYGEPDESSSAYDNHYWTGNDLNVYLHYQPSTDEGILALTH